ncbi:MAG: hypothetical protein Q9165_007729 [Trypethelium subeluteriae]
MAATFLPPTPPCTPPRKTKLWDPVSTLQIYNSQYHNSFTCLGYAETQGRRCRLPPQQGGKAEVLEILEQLAFRTPNFKQMEKELSKAGRAGLCGRWHSWKDTDRQLRYVMRNFETCINLIDKPTQERETRVPMAIKEEDAVEASIKIVNTVKFENATLQASVRDLKQTKDMLEAALQKTLSQTIKQKENFLGQLHEKDELLKKQVQLEDKRQQQRLSEDCRKDEQHAAQLDAAQKARQAEERQRLALESELQSQQASLADREKAHQSAYRTVEEEKAKIQQCLNTEKENSQKLQHNLEHQQTQNHSVQEDLRQITEQSNDLQQRLEREQESNQRIQDTLAQQQTQHQSLRDALRQERKAFVKLAEDHKREMEKARGEREALQKLKELREQEQQDYHRLKAAFDSLQHNQHRLFKDRTRSHRELRRTYQESEVDQSSVESVSLTDQSETRDRRRCRNRATKQNIAKAVSLVAQLAYTDPEDPQIEPKLRQIAELTLCKNVHRRLPAKHDKAVEKWLKDIARVIGTDSRDGSSTDEIPIPSTRVPPLSPVQAPASEESVALDSTRTASLQRNQNILGSMIDLHTAFQRLEQDNNRLRDDVDQKDEENVELRQRLEEQRHTIRTERQEREMERDQLSGDEQDEQRRLQEDLRNEREQREYQERRHHELEQQIEAQTRATAERERRAKDERRRLEDEFRREREANQRLRQALHQQSTQQSSQQEHHQRERHHLQQRNDRLQDTLKLFQDHIARLQVDLRRAHWQLAGQFREASPEPPPPEDAPPSVRRRLLALFRDRESDNSNADLS